MTEPQTISENFISWLETNGFGTFNTNIYLNLIPNSAPDDAFWVVTAGGGGR